MSGVAHGRPRRPAAHPQHGLLAFEHQGIHHTTDAGWGRGRQNVVAIQARDARKRVLAAEHGVTLIVVDDLSPLREGPAAEQHGKAVAQVEAAVSAAGLAVPPYDPPDLSALHSGRLEALRAKAASLGVRLDLAAWPGARAPVRSYCPVHGTWSQTPAQTFLLRTWCCRRGATEPRQAQARARLAAALDALATAGIRPAGQPPTRRHEQVPWT